MKPRGHVGWSDQVADGHPESLLTPLPSVPAVVSTSSTDAGNPLQLKEPLDQKPFTSCNRMALNQSLGLDFNRWSTEIWAKG
jgi:hypothetical protein